MAPPSPTPPVLLALQETPAPASPPLWPDQPRPRAMQQPDVEKGAARGAADGAGWVWRLPPPPSSSPPPPPPPQAQRGGLLPPVPGAAWAGTEPAGNGQPDAGRQLPEGQPTVLPGQQTPQQQGTAAAAPAFAAVSTAAAAAAQGGPQPKRRRTEAHQGGIDDADSNGRSVKSREHATPPSTPTRRAQPPPSARPTGADNAAARGGSWGGVSPMTEAESDGTSGSASAEEPELDMGAVASG